MLSLFGLCPGVTISPKLSILASLASLHLLLHSLASMAVRGLFLMLKSHHHIAPLLKSLLWLLSALDTEISTLLLVSR